MYLADEKRYDTMVYNRCGNSGLKLPLVSLGLWHNFGDTGVYENMKQMCFTEGLTSPHLITESHILILPIIMVLLTEAQRATLERL